MAFALQHKTCANFDIMEFYGAINMKLISQYELKIQSL